MATPKNLVAKKQAMKTAQKLAAKKATVKEARKASKQTAATRTARKVATAAQEATPKKVLKPKGKVLKSGAVKKTKVAATRAPRERNDRLPEGVEFVPGSDMERAFHETLKGGASRTAVARALAEHWKDSPTRNGGAKPVSTIINHVTRRALRSGFHIEETWRIVPDEGVELPQSVQAVINSLNTQEAASKIQVATNATDPKRAKKAARKAGTDKGVRKSLRPAKA